MKPVKRVEIITAAPNKEKVVKLLEEQQVAGYTLLPKVYGKGERGIQDGQGLHNAFDNSMIIIACTNEEIERIKEPLRALLKRYGGVVLVSDAMWLMH